LLLRLWLARRSGSTTEIDAAVRALMASDSAWDSVPHYCEPPELPVWYDDNLSALYGAPSPALTDIGDHLIALFSEAMAAGPGLIVELGTRGGESTRVFLAAAGHTGAHLLCVDLEPHGLTNIPESTRSRFTFVQADDVRFGQYGFVPWCRERERSPSIDVLFVDTSHLYDHTRQEIGTWMPFLADTGVAIFHDTHMDHAFRRNDGSIGLGWNNDRGVIRAIEEFVGATFDETKFFVAVRGEWLVRHSPRSNGLTILRKHSARKPGL
jgi:hypothetical protein